jgi:hypothetical protein
MELMVPRGCPEKMGLTALRDRPEKTELMVHRDHRDR